LQGKTRTRVEVPIHPDLEVRLLAFAGDNPGGFLCPTLARTRVDGRRGLSRQFAHLMSAAGLDQDQVRSARNAFSRKSFHSLHTRFQALWQTRAYPLIYERGSLGIRAWLSISAIRMSSSSRCAKLFLCCRDFPGRMKVEQELLKRRTPDRDYSPGSCPHRRSWLSTRDAAATSGRIFVPKRDLKG
jgi:hypothetical protein